jgi:hypothetical protein
MNEEELERIIAKARNIKALRRARLRVQQLARTRGLTTIRTSSPPAYHRALSDEFPIPFGRRSAHDPANGLALCVDRWSNLAFAHSRGRGYIRNPRLSNRQVDDRSGSRQGQVCVPHPLIITESNQRETTEISAKKPTNLV